MKKILALAGGYSNEREISLITAKGVIKELKKDKKYNILLTEPDGNFVKKLRKFRPNLVLNLLHGRYGEDGYIQSILESERVKYTHSGVLSSSLAIDKEISKKIFIKNKILTPKLIESAKGSYLHRFSWLDDKEVGEISKEWNYLVLEYPESTKAKIFHYTVGAPCFNDFNYGKEAKIWHDIHLKSQMGFDDLILDKKIINQRNK